jgi:hypothetical protein
MNKLDTIIGLQNQSLAAAQQAAAALNTISSLTSLQGAAILHGVQAVDDTEMHADIYVDIY